MAKHTGLGTASMELLRPTVAAGPALDDPAPPDDEPVDPAEGEGRGESDPADRPAPRRRPRRPAPTGKTKARNLHLTDDVHDRLWITARQRKVSVSALANELLDRALPQWELKKKT